MASPVTKKSDQPNERFTSTSSSPIPFTDGAVIVQKTAAGILADLERGVFAPYIERYHDGALDDPLVRAEIAGYLGRLDEMRSALDEVAASARRACLDAELGIYAGDPLEPLEEALRRIGDARGLLNLGRIAKKRGDPNSAIARAARALDAARAEGNAYFEARALHLDAWARIELGQPDGVEAAFAEIFELFDSVGERRFRGLAQNDLGYFLLSKNRADEAFVLFDRAYQAALELGVDDDIMIAFASRFFALYAEGRYVEVVARVEAERALAEQIGDGNAINYLLRLRTCALLAVGDARALGAAEAYHIEAARGTDWDRAAAPLLVERARAQAGDRSALDRIPDLVRSADERNEPTLSAFARLWHWAALADLDGPAAIVRWDELRGAADEKAGVMPALGPEIAAVDGAPRAFRVSAVGKIEIDFLNPECPITRAQGRALLDAAHLSAIYRETDGNATKMSARLDFDRRHLTRTMKKIGLKPKRTGRPKGQSSSGSRPQRSRRKKARDS